MKSLKTKLCVPLLLCFASAVAFCAAPASTRSGDWIVKHSDVAGKIEFSLIQSNSRGRSSSESGWPLTAFQGLDVTKAGRQDVHFNIVRDAGRFECEGFLDNGEGA